MAMTTRKAFSNTYGENNVPYSKLPQRLAPQQLSESSEKGLCFNCESKYSKGHKCNENKLFYIGYEEEEPKEEEAYIEEANLEEIEEATPKIWAHKIHESVLYQAFFCLFFELA